MKSKATNRLYLSGRSHCYYFVQYDCSVFTVGKNLFQVLRTIDSFFNILKYFDDNTFFVCNHIENGKYLNINFSVITGSTYNKNQILLHLHYFFSVNCCLFVSCGKTFSSIKAPSRKGCFF